MPTLTLNPAVVDALITDGGFTYDPREDALVQPGTVRGYAIAIPGTERALGGAFTPLAFGRAVADATSAGDRYSGDVYIGGWYSPERGYMVELATVHNVDRVTAVLIGELRYQDAIYDMATGEPIPLRLTV